MLCEPTPTENVLFYDSFVWLLTPSLDILKRTFTLFSFFPFSFFFFLLRLIKFGPKFFFNIIQCFVF